MNKAAEGILSCPCGAGLVFCAALVVQSGILCGPCCAGLVFCAALVVQDWYFNR
jgi:hypothetical protein